MECSSVCLMETSLAKPNGDFGFQLLLQLGDFLPRDLTVVFHDFSDLSDIGCFVDEESSSTSAKIARLDIVIASSLTVKPVNHSTTSHLTVIGDSFPSSSLVTTTVPCQNATTR